MSYLPDQAVYFNVLFALKDSTGAETLINCCNRPVIGDTTERFPILRSISGVSADMGAYLPLTQGGTIVLDNSPGSLGFERRFSDLFDRLRIIDTEVIIEGAIAAVDDLSLTGGFNQIYKARVQTWRYDVDSDSLSIQVASAPIRKQVLTKVIDSVGFPNAPAASLGKHLPIVIGSNVDVKAVPIDAADDSNPWYAYATSLSSDFEIGGVQAYYAKNADGRFSEVTSAASTSTILFGHTNESGKSDTPYSGSGSNTVRAVKFTASTAYIITHASQRVKTGTSGLPDDGVFIFEIRKANLVQNNAPLKAPGTLLGKAQYNLSSLVTTSTIYDLEVAFEKPIVLEQGEDYYLVTYIISEVAWPGTVAIHEYFDNAVTETAAYTAHVLDLDGQWVEISTSPRGVKHYWQLYGAVLTDTTSYGTDSDGLAIAYVQVTQRSAPTGFTNPEIGNLDMVFVINGLLDNTSGSITGTASLLIEKPHHALQVLDKEYSAGSWGGTSGRIDTTLYSSTHATLSASTNRYYRKIAGRTEGRATVEAITEQIARNSAVRLGLVNSTTSGKNLGVYVWGSESTSAATFSDENARIVSIEQRGTETIVNRLSMYFDQRLVDLDITTGSAEGEFRNYAQTVDWTVGTNTIATALATESQDVFGVRPLADSAFNWLNDSASAEVMAAYFMSVYAKPHTYVVLEAPMFDVTALEVLDVVTIVHPALSAYFGTSSLAKAPSYGGDPGDPGEGQYLKRAKAYRAQIEGRQLNFNLGDVPTIRFACRILDNYPADPT